MRALVTGATGLVGRRLVRALAARGDAVVVVGRDAARLGSSFRDVAAVRALAWDGLHLPAGALDDVDVVFHLAGEPVGEGRWTDARKARIRASRVDSTDAIVAALAASPRPERALICASAIGFFGSRGDELLDERSAPGTGFLAETCVAWEAAARGAEAHGVRVACLRIGVVLARDGGALAKMIPPFKAGVGGRLGDGKQWMSWIHLDDLVALFLFAADEPRATGAIDAVSPAPATNADFTRALGKALGRPTLIPAPAFALRAAFGEMSEVILGSQRVAPTRAEALGFSFRYPALPGALGAIVARPPAAEVSP